MARKKRPHKTSPKTPSRVKKRRAKTKKGHAHHHPELVGLGLAGLGVFLAAILWFGLNGGPAAHLVKGAVGAAAYLAPLVLVPIGALMVARSELIDLRPFRLGLGVALLGLMLTLGVHHGGVVGDGLASLVGLGLGTTGATILGVLLTIAGLLFLTGASLGAILRRTGHVARRAHERVRVRTVRDTEPVHEPTQVRAPPVDVKADYPDLVTDSVSAPPPVLFEREPDEFEVQTNETQETLFDVPKPVGDYKLPDRALLNQSKPGAGPNSDANARVAEALVTCLAHFGVEATVVGQIAGPRVTRYELQLAPGTKVGKVANLKDDLSYALATTEIRILAPIPGKQAVGVEVPNLSPNLVTLGDIYDDLPQSASPVSVWLGKDISGAAVWADLARMPHILIAGTTGSG
jgi:S-DNA-T family DNA segregation ATPase FtsK/SpoIIIE